MRAFVAIPLVVLAACSSASDTTQASKRAASNALAASKKVVADAKHASEDALDASKDALDASKDAATEVLDASRKAAADAKQAWADIPATGELSEQTATWLRAAADQGGTTIENLLVEGTQQAPAAIKIAGALASAVDTDTGLEPIYVKVGDREDADLKIGDMPRMEVVDNLTIGLKRVDSWEGLTQKKERGYLVLWRDDDYLVGFVYRSRREIDIAKVAAELPPLVALVRSTLADAGQ